MTRLQFATIFVSAALVAGHAEAGKVDMPNEGGYTFEFCPIGTAKTFSDNDKFFVMAYDLNAVTRTTPPGLVFDRLGGRCYGIFANVSGRMQDSGFCEFTDLDGDKFWMDYIGHPEGGGGTHRVVHGTGKYNGMTLQGEYQVDLDWGSISNDIAFQGCNPNKGTYKLK